jgi:hypothetical protein
VTKRHLLFLIRRLLVVVSTVLAISLVSCVDLLVVLLLLHGPFATRLKKLSPGFRSLDACVHDRE